MSARYNEEPRGDGFFRTMLFGLVTLTVIPAATLETWIPGVTAQAEPVISMTKCAGLILFILILLAWEFIARVIYLERADDQATSYDEKKRDRGLAALPKLARQQSGRQMALAVLAALSFVIALDAMPVQPWLSVTTMLAAVLGIVAVLWSHLFPVERIIARAFSIFKKHLEDTVRGTLVNGVHAPVHSDIVIDRDDDDRPPQRGVLSGLLYLLVVVGATAAVLGAGYYGLQHTCQVFGVACKAATNASILMHTGIGLQ